VSGDVSVIFIMTFDSTDVTHLIYTSLHAARYSDDIFRVGKTSQRRCLL